MKITVTKENLASALGKASKAVSTRAVIPILFNVMLHAEGDRLTISAADSEISIVTWVPALVEEEGSITLPSKKFLQIVSALPSADVTLNSEDDENATVRCAKSFYKIHGLSAANFPKIEESVYDWSFKVKAKDFIRNLGKVSYARSNDDNRKQLNGVVMSIRGGMLTMAATDGRRLALMESTLDDEATQDGDYILPSRAATELAGSIDATDDLLVSLNKFGVSFQSANTILVTKLVEGSYPNFRQVIPENCGAKVAVPRVSFTDALKRVSLVVIDQGGSVKLTFCDNKLLVSASNAETGESLEPLDIAYDGEEVSVSFNPVYFTDPLKVMENDSIEIEFGKQFTPIKVTGDEGFLYMLMPMRG